VVTLIHVAIIIVTRLFLGLDHDELPRRVTILFKIHVDLADRLGWIQVNPEVLVVEDGLD
jgi:hypothetical protein